MSPKLALERTRAQLYSTVSAASAVFVAPRTHACSETSAQYRTHALMSAHSHRCIHTVVFTPLHSHSRPTTGYISPDLPASPQISPHHPVGFSTDYGLPKSEAGVPKLKDEEIALRMRYSHFGCNVVHEDVCVKAGAEVDTASATAFLLELRFFSLGGCRGRHRVRHRVSF